MKISCRHVNICSMKQKTFDMEMKEIFGGKVCRLALQTGCTCPNRDGTKGTGGCIFCSEGGSGDFAADPSLSVAEQIEAAKLTVSKKLSKSFAGYMAYFQSFTNTYGPCERLRAIFTEALMCDDIVALSIGTRPDCLPDGMIKMLSSLNRIKPLYVELGLQTMHEDTAVLINRCYSLPVFEDAVMRLRAEGIKVVVHMIAGLPGEDEKRILETASYLSEFSHSVPGMTLINGVKLQILQVLRNTRLQKAVQDDPAFIKEYTLEEYTELLKKILDILPSDMTVHRLTGDPPKKLLISPQWTADKRHVLNCIKKELLLP